jgi:hypothetical protein
MRAVTLGHRESAVRPDRLTAANALERTRTAMPYGTTPSRWRVYQFHHQGNITALAGSSLRALHPSTRDTITASHLINRTLNKTTGPTGLEPATSRVTVECSNQAELRPQLLESGSETPSSPPSSLPSRLSVSPPNSPKGNRTPLCTVKGCRPNR